MCWRSSVSCFLESYMLQNTVQDFVDEWFTHITGKKSSSHQVTITLATSENVLFPGHNHLQTTSADDPTLCLSPEYLQLKDYQ